MYSDVFGGIRRYSEVFLGITITYFDLLSCFLCKQITFHQRMHALLALITGTILG